MYRLKESVKKSGKSFPKGINAVIFLSHKPIGLGKTNEVLQINDDRVWEFLRYIDVNNFPFKIGFDSCSVPALIQLNNIDINSLDTCEGGRWSAYISADMKMMPCSFDNQLERWAVDLNKHKIIEAWNSEKFNNFREHFHNSCRKCENNIFYMGGCPIAPEIVLCKQRDFVNSND